MCLLLNGNLKFLLCVLKEATIMLEWTHAIPGININFTIQSKAKCVKGTWCVAQTRQPGSKVSTVGLISLRLLKKWTDYLIVGLLCKHFSKIRFWSLGSRVKGCSDKYLGRYHCWLRASPRNPWSWGQKWYPLQKLERSNEDVASIRGTSISSQKWS